MESNTTERQFVERMFRLRMLGFSLGMICVGSVLLGNGAPPLVWGLWALNGLSWPFVARFIALRSDAMRRAEIANLLIDCAFGGAWIALMQFNLLPSAVVCLAFVFDRLCLGGTRLMWRALASEIVACLLVAAGTNFAVRTETTMLEILLTLPLLVIYPLTIASTTHRLARAVTQHNRRLVELSRIDIPTGLLNRSAWEDLALVELLRHQRAGNPASLLMIDIDHFKSVNDMHGHPIGDEVIRRVAAVLRGCTRDVDLLGRYGGDEFCIVLVHTDVDAALRVADRIRLSVLAGTPDVIPISMLSVSIGVASTATGMHDIRAWIKRADVALLEAKARGRDRVSVAA